MNSFAGNPNSPGEAALRAFAHARGLRIRRQVHVYLDPRDPGTLTTTVTDSGRRCRLVASAVHLALSIKAEVPVFFSVGAHHPALLTGSPVEPSRSLPLPVFASRGFEKDVLAWLSQHKAIESLLALELRLGESLHVARNESLLIIHADRDIDEALVRLIHFVTTVESTTKPVSPDARLLPVGFEDLEGIARLWAIADDVDRAERLAVTGTKQRNLLRRSLLPRLTDIDAYLDALRGPLTDDAIRLQQLGELGAELRLQAE